MVYLQLDMDRDILVKTLDFYYLALAIPDKTTRKVKRFRLEFY